MVPAVMAVQAGIGVVQSIAGGIQSIKGNKELKRLRQLRTARQTPQEFYDLNNMALNAAQTGYGAQTLDYLTIQNDRSLSSSLGALTSLGGDPNSIGSILDRNFDNIMKVGSDNELMKMQKFNNVISTTVELANQKLADAADKELMIKDDMAAAAQKVAAGNKNLQSGLNAIGGAAASFDANNLYKTKPLPKYSEQQEIGMASKLNTSVDMLDYTSKIRQAPQVNVSLPNYNNGFIGPVIPSWYN